MLLLDYGVTTLLSGLDPSYGVHICTIHVTNSLLFDRIKFSRKSPEVSAAALDLLLSKIAGSKGGGYSDYPSLTFHCS